MITPASIGLPPKFSHFRDEVKQRQTIEKLAICDSRFLLLNAPPGVGKSLIGNSLGLLMSYRYLYLTRTKSLQQQNYFDMKPVGMSDIVGHSNYSCSRVTYDDLGELADIECKGRRDGSCLYQQDVDLTLKTDQVSSNYAHWIQTHKSGDPLRLGTFDLLILDEAHTIRATLAESASLKIFFSQVERYLEIRTPSVSDSLDAWVDWSRDAHSRSVRKLDTLSEDRSSSRRDVFYTRLTQSLLRLHSEESTADWVPIPIYDKGIQFKPCNVAAYSEPYLFRGVEKILLMSATLFRDDAALLGIPDDDSSYFEIQSAFSHRRRPIIYFPTVPPVKVDNKMNRAGERLWINQIDKVLEFEGNSKGIIQSRSYDRAEAIYNQSTLRDRIIFHTKENSQSSIKKFRESPPPCFIVSPILEEGEDFAYNLCDTVIIPKMPFLNMHEPYNRAMGKLDKDYQIREVCRAIIQMALRGMRAHDDWCRVWVLDSHFAYIRKAKWFYSWFRIAFRQIDKLSQAPSRPTE